MVETDNRINPAANPGSVELPSCDVVFDFENMTIEEIPEDSATPVLAPTEASDAERIMTRDEALAVLQGLLGEETVIPDDKIDRLILAINRMINHQDSETLSCATVAAILEENNEALRDFIRFYSLGLISETEGVGSTPVAGALTESDASLEDFANLTGTVLSDNILPPAVLQAIHGGTLRIKIRFTQNRQGEFDNFAVIIQSRNHEEIVAEYRDGAIVSGNPPTSPLARGIIAYLQRLLRGTTGNQYSFGEEGVFDRQTLEAMYSYMSRENLLSTSFDSASLQQVLDQRLIEADEAAAAYSTAPTADIAALNNVLTVHQDYLTLKGDLEIQYGFTIDTDNSDNMSHDLGQLRREDRERFLAARQAYLDAMEQFGGREAFNQALTDANLRYRMAQDTLNDLLAVTELAASYQDIDLNSANLSDQDRTFIQACRDAADACRPQIESLLAEILNEENGLMLLDIRSYRNGLVEYQHALQRNNERKQSEALDRFSNQAYRILSQLRRWENAAQRDPDLFQTLTGYRTNLNNRMRTEITDRLPSAENQRLQEQLTYIDQVVMTQIEGDRSVESLSLEQIRARFSRAAQLSDTLGSGQQRDMIISFLQDSLRERAFDDIQQLFDFFSSVSDQASLETDCQTSVHNNILESFGLSGTGSGNATARRYLADHMAGRSMDQTLNRMMRLAANLYFLMEQYNQYANSAEGQAHGAQPLTFSDIITTAKLAVEAMKNPDGSYIDDREANAILRVLSRTSDNADIARIEIAKQKDEALKNFYLRDHSRLRGANELTFSPRAIHELEADYAESSAVYGLVSYADLQRWSPELIPPGAGINDYFYVSINGVQRVDPSQLPETDLIPRILPNNLGGEVFTRDPMKFLENEILATLKLAIIRYVPVSDEQVTMLDGAITARLTALDLRGIIRVYGEGSIWTFRPNSLTLGALEKGALRTVADIAESADPESNIPALLRRLAGDSADIRFSADERTALINWFDANFPPGTDLAQLIEEKYPSLDSIQKQHLRSAVNQLRTAFPQMQHKEGLSQNTQVHFLNELAGFLAWADELPEGDPLRQRIALYDARLTDTTPPSELVAALREAAQRLGHDFNEGYFRTVYGEAVATLRYLHRTILVQASKFPAEDPGWDGDIISFVQNHFEQMWESGREASAPPNQSSTLTAGLPSEIVFMINMLIYSQDGPNNDIIDELGRLNSEIETLRHDLGVQVEGATAPGQENPLIDAVGACRIILQSPDITALRTRIGALLQNEDGDLRFGPDDRDRAYLNEFIRQLDLLGQYSERPSDFIVQAEGLMESTLLQIEQLSQAIEAETNEEKRAVLISMKNALESVYNQLSGLVEYRNEQLPGFLTLNDKLLRSQEIMDTLYSDRFDAAKFRLLTERLTFFHGGDDWQTRLLDWFGGILNGDQGELAIPDLTNGPESILDILNRFFSGGGEASVSSLIPSGGESRETLLAKLALSKVLEMLPREQLLNLYKVLPTTILGPLKMTHGAFSLVRDVPAIYAGLTGEGNVTIGPTNLQELLDTVNDPANRFIYNLESFCALSSDQNPQVNNSSQLYALLRNSRRETIRSFLSEAILPPEGATSWLDAGMFPLDRVDRRAVEMFLEYFREELMPQLNNPAIRQFIEEQHRLNKIPLSLDELLAYASQETGTALVDSLPSDAPFQITDSFHSEGGKRDLAQLLETVLAVAGELNQSRAVEDLDLYSPSYFAPLQTVEDNCLKYQDTDHPVAPLRELRVIRYSSAPQPGKLDELSFLEMKERDIEDWIDKYGEDALPELLLSFDDDPAKFMEEALSGAGEFGVHLVAVLGRQIEMGFADSWGGLAELARAIRSGNKQQMIDALRQWARGLAATTGSFMVFDMAPFLFFSEVIDEIENKNYGSALGKALAITMMTWRSLGIYWNTIETLARAGHAKITEHGIFIRDPQEAARLYEERMGRARQAFERSLFRSTGMRLLFYQLNPFALVFRAGVAGVHGLGAVAASGRYLYRGLDVQVRSSSVQLRMVREVSADPSTWHQVASFTDRYRIMSNFFDQPIFSQMSTFPRRAVDFFGRAKGTFSSESFMLYDAFFDPAKSFEFTLGKGGRARGTIYLDGATYQELVKARAAGTSEAFSQFCQIMQQHNRRAGEGSRYNTGSLRQLWNALKAPAEMYSQMREYYDGIEPQSRPFDPVSYLQDLTVGDGLGSRFQLTLPEIDPATGQPRVVELNGQQVAEILANDGSRPSVSRAVDAAVKRYFRQHVPARHLRGMVAQIRRYIIRGSFGRARFANVPYLQNLMARNWLNRALRRLLHLPGITGTPAIPNMDALKRSLANNPLVDRYARELGISKRAARERLARDLYEDYMRERADIVAEELNNHAADPDGPLTPEERARVDREGAVRRSVRPSSPFRRLLARARAAITSRLASHDTDFRAGVDDRIRARTEADIVANPHAPVTEYLPETGRQIFRQLGVPEADLAGVTTREAFLEKFGQQVGERMPEFLQRLKQTDIRRFNEFMRFVTRPTAGQRVALTAAGLVSAFLSFFPAEELFNYFGLENEKARFLLGQVQGIGIDAAVRHFGEPLIRGRLVVEIERGLANTSWVKKIGGSAVNLLKGMGYSMLVASLYTGLLDTFGVGQDSWMRSETAQMAVGFGGSTLLIEFGGTAVIPLAVAKLISELPNVFYYSKYQRSLNTAMHTEARQFLASRGAFGKTLLAIDCFFEPILGGLQETFNRWINPEMYEEAAKNDSVRLRVGEMMTRASLREMYLHHLMKYNGEANDNIFYFNRPSIRDTYLTGLLRGEITFRNGERPFGMIEPGETYCRDEETGSVCRVATMPEQRIVYEREADAYNFVEAYNYYWQSMSDATISGETITSTLRSRYHITDLPAFYRGATGIKNGDRDLMQYLRDEFDLTMPEWFMEKVAAKDLQEYIKSIISLNPEDELGSAELGNNLPQIQTFRYLFDDNGYLRDDREEAFYAWMLTDLGDEVVLNGSATGQFQQTLRVFRMITRIQALLNGETPNEIDRQLGLVNQDGTINENNEYYIMMVQGAIGTLLGTDFTTTTEEEMEAHEPRVEGCDPDEDEADADADYADADADADYDA
ncbi:MAG: hypothetical protein PHH60_00265 [Candidatus Margulisbacteria bacterium]|nr:hypothetical protein [Candidatus Margulisiibacteriota bacterium]